MKNLELPFSNHNYITIVENIHGSQDFFKNWRGGTTTLLEKRQCITPNAMFVCNDEIHAGIYNDKYFVIVHLWSSIQVYILDQEFIIKQIHINESAFFQKAYEIVGKYIEKNFDSFFAEFVQIIYKLGSVYGERNATKKIKNAFLLFMNSMEY